MAKFQNKYRIESIRLKGWDYRHTGAYFITICTHNRVHHFGECRDGKMKLSTMGLIVQGCWYEIPRLNDQVRLGEFVVMPNHVHGILMLVDGDEIGNGNEIAVETLNFNVSTDDTPVDDNNNNEYFKNITPKPGSVSRIIQQFKRAATYHLKCTFPDAEFAWQERFHDHIIRSEESFVRISNYIINNPLNWDEDMFFLQE